MKIFAFLAISIALPAMALPLPGVSTNALPEFNFNRDYDFNGIVKLSNCSASVFHFEGQSLDDNALILTNGHCVKLMDPNEVMVGQSAFQFLRIYDANSKFASQYFISRNLVYGVMKYTDLAVYQIPVTYRELKDKYSVDSLLLSKDSAEVGANIAVVSGYFKSVTECQLDGFVPHLKESDWTFHDSIRYTEECKVIPGTSGSPIVDLDSGKIVGVNNTMFEGGEACSINNPCEVGPDGEITTYPGRGYGQQTYLLYSCINSDFEIDLSTEGCELPKPSRD